MSVSIEMMEKDLKKLQKEAQIAETAVQPEIDRLNTVLAGLNELAVSSKYLLKEEDNKTAVFDYVRGIAESQLRVKNEIRELQAKPKDYSYQIAGKIREIEDAKKSYEHKMMEKSIREFFDSSLSFQEKFDKLEQFFVKDFNNDARKHSYSSTFADSVFVKKHVRELLGYKYSDTQVEKMMEIASDFVYQHCFDDSDGWSPEPRFYFGTIEVAMKVLDFSV